MLRFCTFCISRRFNPRRPVFQTLTRMVNMATSTRSTESNNGKVWAADDFNKRDIRDTKLWGDLHKHFHDLMSPAFGKVSDAADPELSPDGKTVSFTGSIWTKLEGSAEKRVCTVDVATCKMEVIAQGPNNDQQAKWSPNGRSLAFLSDRSEKGTFHLYVLDLDRLREAKPVRLPKGETAEYALWSPKGDYILIGAAGQGADKAGGNGSGNLNNSQGDGGSPAWMPTVEPDSQKKLGRSLWLYDLEKDDFHQLSRPELTVWESAWCGPAHIVAIASDDPSESSWYESSVMLIDASSGSDRTVYTTDVQLGLPAASPSGRHVAFVEGPLSDRGVVAGTAKLVKVGTKASITLDTANVDVSQLSWADEDRLFFIGLRGLHVVAGEVNVKTEKVRETWTTADGVGGRYPEASGIVDGRFAVVRSSWTTYPEVAVVQHGKSRTIASLDHEGAAYLRSACGPMEEISWTASDGTEIQGYLSLPKSGKKPHPLVLHVHGGPIAAFSNGWQLKYPFVPVFAANGYAVLSPNPRGSKGRGDAFVSQLQGDMGGIDAGDLLSGIDVLVEKGIVDPKRVGVMGGSYGGFMAAWLPTQSKRFAAAIPLAPVTDWFSEHTTSNIGNFDRMMMSPDDPYAPAGRYYDQSPLRFVQHCSTPVLQLVGADDRCVPASQSLQFHNALVEHGTESSLVTYPGEGHGVRKFPAVIDLCVRMLAWLNRHMPA
ncbi:acylaminoacyl-peptidase [Neohortaea acidophila]|uniref:Dipeptidyl-peptidase V n=1 Tax=Neohortaea acidophila TaxID=245834 RepID=A0A6A6Q2T3_9PEZI|nr:acylaminoacyl-peptidase [Neohortaea acidophila]KAF2485737.1 acylaminoacyl-peptidase [Neohortaea acidophila]